MSLTPLEFCIELPLTRHCGTKWKCLSTKLCFYWRLQCTTKSWATLKWSQLCVSGLDPSQRQGVEELISSPPCHFDHATLFSVLQKHTLQHRMNDSFSCLVCWKKKITLFCLGLMSELVGFFFLKSFPFKVSVQLVKPFDWLRDTLLFIHHTCTKPVGCFSLTPSITVTPPLLRLEKLF